MPLKGGGGGIAGLKASLKDPSFVATIHGLEDKRQDLYLGILRKHGQIVQLEEGGSRIVSYPQTPIKFPNNLKKPLRSWSDRDKVCSWQFALSQLHYALLFAQ